MKKVKASLAVMGITLAAVGTMAVAAAAQGNAPAERAARVETCQVTLGNVEQVLAVNGVLRYETEYAAISPATGVVAQVYVQAGDRVQAGQPLFRLKGEVQAAAVSAALAQQGSYADMLPVTLAGTSLQEAAAQLECLTVRASADGLVQQVSIVPHGGVMAGTPAMVLSGEKQCIQCSVVLRDAQELRQGMQARIIKDGEMLTMAHVAEIGPAQVSDTTGQTVCQVKLVPMEDIRLPLGAMLEAEILLYGQANVPVLPVEAVTDSGTVWWVADGRSYEVPVQVVMADEVCCWVNLPEGTTVVSRGDTEEGRRVKEMKP